MFDTKEIGNRMMLVRKCFKLNQVMFSKEIEVTQQTVSQIETGVIAPSLEIIYKITGNFGISYDWIIAGEGSMLKIEGSESRGVNFIHSGDGHNIINNKYEEQRNNLDLYQIKMEVYEKEIDILKQQISELKNDKEQLFAMLNKR